MHKSRRKPAHALSLAAGIQVLGLSPSWLPGFGFYRPQTNVDAMVQLPDM